MHEVNWKCKKKILRNLLHITAMHLKLNNVYFHNYDLIQLKNHFVPSMLKTPNEWPDANKFTK